MSEHSHDHAQDGDNGHGEDHGHTDANYIKIWKILLVLLVISVAGPFLEIKSITLITAFGIAFVKAYIVIKHFMHINIEKPFVHYFLVTSLVFLVLFFAAVSPDVMRHEGTNWTHVSSEEWIVHATAIEEAKGSHHGESDEHGDEPDDHGAENGEGH